jgi:hypothetical protein
LRFFRKNSSPNEMAQRIHSEDDTFYSFGQQLYNQSSRRERSRNMIDDAHRQADSIGTTVVVEVSPGEKVRGPRKPDSKTTRDSANLQANEKGSQVPVQSKKPLVIRSRGGKVMGKANTRPSAQMEAHNANPNYISQRSRELDALVAERARKL